MSFTLWRGSQLLGELRVREQSTGGISGVLVPVDGVEGLTGVMQTKLDIFPGHPVFQNPVDPFVVGESGTNPQHTSSHSGPVPLRRLTEAEAQGIAAEHQLSVRDEAGDLLLSSMVLVTEFRFRPGTVATAFPELPRDRGSAWMVVAVFDGTAPVGH